MTTILPATYDDIPDLVKLVDSCFSGELSRKGWTTRVDFIDGSRVTPESMKVDMGKPGALILKDVDSSTGRIIACAYTQKQQDKLFTGMLCVQPDLQANGLGKKMMEAIDQLGKDYKCSAVRIEVISGRTELINWYERKGFRKTGEIVPFPMNEGRGNPKMPLEFLIMEKPL